MRSLQTLCVLVVITSSSQMKIDNNIVGDEKLDNDDNLSIKEVLDTDEDLWLYWQTEKNSLDICDKDECIVEVETCIRNQKISMSDQEYKYRQLMLLDGSLVSTTYKGTFVNDTVPPKSMEVVEYYGGIDMSQLYTLQYTDEEHSCNVFFVNSLYARIANEKATCEMYLLDHVVDKKPPQSCQTFFKQKCNSTRFYKPYKKDCQKLYQSKAIAVAQNDFSQ
uniref:Putative lipocalin-3 1 n=1 Tax=Amblyomma triste TaxID=251400 RepID=A0A023G9Y7_AMBTT